MRFLVITNAPTLKGNGLFSAYSPYVNEMDIWTKHVSDFKIISPNTYKGRLLTKPFKNQPELESIPTLNFTSLIDIFISVLSLPIIVIKLIIAMYWADHIHLRCPGNVGLIACFAQICFSKKVKTAKYAGNWDPNAKTQPKSYKLQKWLLSNTFLTKKMTVLVYGHWENQTKNIKSFFTATYYDNEKPVYHKKNYTEALQFLFVGSLVDGKRPLFAIKMVEQLHKDGIKCSLEVFGDGVLREELQAYIDLHKIDYITLHGNQTKEVLQKYLSQSHFSILASKSEGWPKAVAEAMFYGVIPISTRISCVPFMLDNEARGILIEPEITSAIKRIKAALDSPSSLHLMAKEAQNWSQNYTLDYFETEIKQLLS